jgi:predicted RNase H-like nuclease (RuvC/YqgF family)
MILIGALLALNIGIGINLWLNTKEKEQLKSQNASLSNDKTVLQQELDQQISELEALKAENQGLNDQLSDKDNAIEQKIKQIKLLLNKGKLSDKEFKKAKEEILNLRSQIEEYKLKIAELTQKNEELTAENLGLTENLSTEQYKSAEKDRLIENRDKTIGIAKRLHASAVEAVAVRERKLFGKKEVTTDKANRAEEIRVSFSVDKNAISDAGEKDIFVKIIGPDGSPITSKMQTTIVDGTETLYTEMKTIDYQNERQESVVYCKKQGDFGKGEYTIEIYAEGYKVGNSKFTLR